VIGGLGRAAQPRLVSIAYADITGETWKPYVAPLAPAAGVARQSAAAEMSAFETP
jgi:hypothetical protein